MPQGPARIFRIALCAVLPGVTSFALPQAIEMNEVKFAYSFASSFGGSSSGRPGGAIPFTPWQGAAAQGMIGPPPCKTSLTVSKVGGIELLSAPAPLLEPAAR